MTYTTVIWLQTGFDQNGRAGLGRQEVSSQTAPEKTTQLRGEFAEQFIPRLRPFNWSPWSSDLMSLDYLLWDYVKAHVYMDKSTMVHTLNANIEEFIRESSSSSYLNILSNIDRTKKNHSFL